jgi:hypothetical protein
MYYNFISLRKHSGLKEKLQSWLLLRLPSSAVHPVNGDIPILQVDCSKTWVYFG